ILFFCCCGNLFGVLGFNESLQADKHPNFKSPRWLPSDIVNYNTTPNVKRFFDFLLPGTPRLAVFEMLRAFSPPRFLPLTFSSQTICDPRHRLPTAPCATIEI